MKIRVEGEPKIQIEKPTIGDIDLVALDKIINEGLFTFTHRVTTHEDCYLSVRVQRGLDGRELVEMLNDGRAYLQEGPARGSHILRTENNTPVAYIHAAEVENDDDIEESFFLTLR